MSNQAYPEQVSSTFSVFRVLLLRSDLTHIMLYFVTVVQKLLPKTDSEYITFKDCNRVR